jgi:probable HAF family extracellular repeat protein
MKSSQHRYRLPLLGTRVFCGWMLLLLAAGSAVPAAPVPAYRVEDLSAYGSDADSRATAINAAGRVTCIVSSPGTNATNAFLWDEGATWDVGTTGGESIRALGLNGGSQVVGEAVTPDGQSSAFLWTSGVMRRLGTLGGDHSAAFGINTAGQAAGASTLAGNQSWHAFQWSDGAMHDLGTLGGRSSWGFGINEGGEVAGDSTTAGERALHAFRAQWAPGGGTMQDLGTLGGSRSLALAIRGTGRGVVGHDRQPRHSRIPVERRGAAGPRHARGHEKFRPRYQ